jgi:hypothetical protein
MPPKKSSVKNQSKFNKELAKLKASADQQERGASSLLELEPEKRDADTRQKIAKLFIIWYFALLLAILIGMPIYNLVAFATTGNEDLFVNMKDVLQVYSSIVGPLAGFVIAYYFKNK